MQSGFHLERFDYVRLDERLAVVRLRAGLGAEAKPPADAALVVRFGAYATWSPACDAKLQWWTLPRGEVLWSALFAVAVEVVEYPSALFELRTADCAALALPMPALRELATAGALDGLAGWSVAGQGRRLAAAATILAVTAAATPAISAAAWGAPRANATFSRGTATSTPPRPGLIVHTRPSVHKLWHPTAHAGRPTSAVRVFSAARVPAPGKRRPTGGTAITPPPAAGKPAPPAPAPAGPGPVPPPPSHRVMRPAPRHQHPAAPRHEHPAAPRHQHPAAPRHQHPAARRHRHPTTGGAPIAIRPRVAPRPALTPSPPASFSTAGSAPESVVSTAFSRLSTLLARGNQPPSFLIPIYKAASHRYHVPWRILAAINEIETNYGRNLNVSSAGAIGWMQFMPSTWHEYGVDVGRRGRPNPYDPRDAIFSAARYLEANGARHDLRKAIFAYNHAAWYVEEVLWTAEGIADHTPRATATVRHKLGAMRGTALLLNGLPYIWGGGHGGWGLQPGYDCSGFVSAVLHAAGYLTVPVNTQALPSQPGIRSGPGRFVTIFDRTNVGVGSDHVIIEIDGEWWESGGSTAAGGGASVHRIAGISADYLATFNQILHPRGL